ncbi:hypothetical protein JQ615_34760 [Bradyrhizobium jicamae]|uniref:Uncharacterized protein n=2 Tax=Bradyrhizobium jicamae TaxID=280332 RepID=A0ABS5FUM4_9BRAD|nr:hypothetical protein [Bradyrhizobium jicamae]MBR0800538.1 hypothetical protein [Bradyrhizobium jicamae]
MPMARYFLFVGGAMLALLLLLGAYLPSPSVTERSSSAHPSIRIHSMEKLPDLVVYDTSRPIMVPEQVAQVPDPAAAPALAPAAAPVGIADASPGNRTAFAQMQQSVAERPKLSAPKPKAAKPPHEHAHARRHAPSYYWLYAERRPRFGWFDSYVW